MKYKDFKKYNKRSKALNEGGRKNIVFIKDIHFLNKENEIDLKGIYNLTQAEDCDIGLPNEEISCLVDTVTHIPDFPEEMLLCSLIQRVIACNVWIINPQILREGILPAVRLLPEYTPICVIYDTCGFFKVMISGLEILILTKPEIVGVSAEELQMRALKNLRRYGFISADIEDRLLKEIRKALESPALTYLNEVGIGPL